MSAFALPISPEEVTLLPSQTYGTLRYRSVISCQLSAIRETFHKAIQHAADFRMF
jgi:hypothetical protein